MWTSSGKLTINVCGIVGIVAQGSPVPTDVLERASHSLSHRGPDDSGTALIQAQNSAVQIGIGHRRLAILDLSPSGHQPMHDPVTGNWIVFNGEIYNFQALRCELERNGIQFSGRSDSEVLLKAYGFWGEQCLERLNGMFAFAIWDARRQHLFLARDPLGIKPLYYYASGRHFLFASEVRTLLGTGLVPRRIDLAGLSNYLSFGSVYEPNTLIDGVRSLRAGHHLTWKAGQVREVCYWEFPIAPKIAQPSPETPPSAEDLRDQLGRAFHSQMVSDVPVGVFLSGGIDSSTLVAFLSSSHQKVSTFSLIFREGDFSEAEHSRAVAEKFHTDHREIMVSQDDLLSSVPDALAAMDQPTLDGVNTYLVSREARRAGIKVALSGLGADELFAGYTSFHTVPRMQLFYRMWHGVPSLARQSAGAVLRTMLSRNDRSTKLAALAAENGRLHHSWFLSRMLFTPSVRDRLLPGMDTESSIRADDPLCQALRQSRELDAVNQVSYLESRCYMLNTLLRDSDAMSMAHGLELRVPFLDRELVGKVFSLPGKTKMERNSPKPLLVRALAGALPESVVRRPKRGFSLPFEHWMRDQMRKPIETRLAGRENGPLFSLLDPQATAAVWNQFVAGETSWSRPWALYALDRWCESHLS
jgi:asparagine synthase (glutamine-hydrolysing)